MGETGGCRGCGGQEGNWQDGSGGAEEVNRRHMLGHYGVLRVRSWVDGGHADKPPGRGRDMVRRESLSAKA